MDVIPLPNVAEVPHAGGGEEAPQDIDSLQSWVLDQLDDLNRQIEAVIKEASPQEEVANPNQESGDAKQDNA